MNSDMTADAQVLDDFPRAVAEFDRRVRDASAAGPDVWSAPTPCAEWDVRALVNHLVGELRWVPPLLAGQTVAEVGDALDGDLLGDDPVRAWDDAVAGVRAAIGPDALDRTVHLSYGDSTGASYLAEVATDLTLHSWDLARGIGADDTIDPDLVRVTRERVEPMAEMLAGSGVFGTPVDVGDDADPQTRLLALVGRQR
jgi:uncharacterized protein (TIGR03086 family)